MIENRDYLKTKNPWHWLVWGDKSGFTVAWLIAGIIATWACVEYGWPYIFTTAAFFAIVLAILCIYRYNDYCKQVRAMDILSFAKWSEYKSQGLV